MSTVSAVPKIGNPQPVRVRFVCDFHAYRSLPAEGLLKAMAAEENLDGLIRASSAGTMILTKNYTRLRFEHMEEATHVLTMEENISDYLIQKFPQFARKVQTVRQFINQPSAVSGYDITGEREVARVMPAVYEKLKREVFAGQPA